MANGHKILVRADENSKRPIALENAGDQLLLGFSFTSDWWREWHEFFWTNYGGKKSETSAISDQFRYSIGNVSLTIQ